MMAIKKKTILQRSDMYKLIERQIKEKLEKIEITDNDTVNEIPKRYFYHLMDQAGDKSRMEQTLQASICEHELPPMLFASSAELQKNIVHLAKEYGLNTTQLDIDKGQQFSYQLQSFFPSKFEKQVCSLQFDWEDTGADADKQHLERLIRNLGLTRVQILEEISKFAQAQRRNSILGALKFDRNTQMTEDKAFKESSDALSQEQFTRQNLLLKIKTIEFFSFDETPYKLRRADWLDLVCFEPNIQEAVKIQNNILSGRDNAVDTLLKAAFDFTDVNDSTTVNKILDEASQSHISKIVQMQANMFLDDVKDPEQFVFGQELKTNGQIDTLKKAAVAQKMGKQASSNQYDSVEEIRRQRNQRLTDVPNVDPLNQSLSKCFYSLRYIKTRDIKIKLLHVVNYFRAVQRILCHDLNEYFTREKQLGDRADIIGPQFGTNGQGRPMSKQGNNGGVFNNNIKQNFDAHETSGTAALHPLNFKGYKYHKAFNPKVSSTCPLVPKHHRTYGRPSVYEQVSEQVDREANDKLHNSAYMHSLLIKKDRIIVNENLMEIHVLNEYGNKILYAEAIEDLTELEEELLKIGSYYINQHEFLQAHNDIVVGSGQGEIKTKQSMIDRSQICFELYEKEFAFQFQKVLLIEQMLESYEHTFDPLESTRILQGVVDVMAQRPRLNIEATLYGESYDAEIEVLKNKYKLYREFIDFQKENEEAENKQVMNFQELKFRKLQEHVQGQWRVSKEEAKVIREGSDEQQSRQAAGGIYGTAAHLVVEEQVHKKQEEKQKALDDIAAKHITEFANDQYTDFAQVLGLPEITIEDLVKKKDSEEPFVLDSLRERSFFAKQLEGYPAALGKDKQVGSTLGLHCDNVGLTDFYESLSIFPRVTASLAQSFSEMLHELTPENGFATSCLELCMVQEARLRLRKIRNNDQGIAEREILTGQHHIEEDFYLSNSDKLIFMMRQLKSDVHPSNLYSKANPLVISNLDMRSVISFNFPRLSQKEVTESFTLEEREKMKNTQGNDMLVARMINMAKKSTARHVLTIKDDFGEHQCIDTSNKDKVVDTVDAPSMMRMSCNMIEVLRLREELIARINETEILSEVYRQQAQLFSKPPKTTANDQIVFSTASILTDHMNFVDTNDGMRLKFDLPFCEFDQTLAANLDFKSESCIKALCTDLGVEEMRAILQYQITHQQVLQTAITTNQLLIDAPLRGLMELELLEHNISVPNAVINIYDLFSQNCQDFVNVNNQKKEEQKVRAKLSKVNEYMYLALPKKSRERKLISKKFQAAVNKLQQQPLLKPEAKLRTLRAYRLQLLHQFCNNIAKEVQADSLKIQSLQTCNELRKQALLMPKSYYYDELFHVGMGEFQENLSYESTVLLAGDVLDTVDDSNHNFKSLMSGKFSPIIYVPTTPEVMALDIWKMPDQGNTNDVLLSSPVDYLTCDKELKSYSRMPKYLEQPGYVVPEGQTHGIRKVNFHGATNYETDSYKLLCYLTLCLRVFTLIYIMARNATESSMMLELERKIFSGRPFWTHVQKVQRQIEKKNVQVETPLESAALEDASKTHSRIEAEYVASLSASERVIKKILDKKKAWMELTEDMGQIGEKVLAHFKLFTQLTGDRRTMNYGLDLLTILHHSTFYQMINGLENISEIYRQKQNNEYFTKIQEVYNIACKRQPGLLLLNKNGYYITQASISPLHMRSEATYSQGPHGEHDEFMQSYSPIIDENALIPQEVRVVQRLFGQTSQLDHFNKDIFLWSHVRNYAGLMSSFYNLDNEARSFAAANFDQVEAQISDYLIYKGLKERPEARIIDSERGNNQPKSPQKKVYSKDHQRDQLVASVEVLTHKVEAAHLQKVIMSWIQGGVALPQSTRVYSDVLRKYQDMTMMRIFAERDVLNEIYWTQVTYRNKNVSAELRLQLNAEKSREKSAILDTVNTRSPEFQYFDKVNIVRAESMIIKKILEVKLVKMGLGMIKSEHDALISTFEQCAEDKYVHHFVHPQQQFASTLFQQVDRNAHLDIVCKLGFVQQFLTRLRNRCTEVETLTSGPGIVFSMKDFNDCLQIFCKQLIKYGESELRSRCETQSIREQQYHHLIYLREMETLYYQKKLESFLTNIDSIINAKMSAKGNQMVYELDSTSRELRTLKDHYYEMEKLMREEVRHEFREQLSKKDDTIKRLSENFANFRKEITYKLKETVQKELNSDIEGIAQHHLSYVASRAKEIDKIEANERREAILRGDNAEKKGKQFDPDAVQEIVKQGQFFRKYKILTLMKRVIAEEKHEKELQNQKLKLSENQNLWDQLAEAEKREQITRQELELTKQNLTHYERLIEKLYGQLEHLNNQKTRLQQYKTSKSKRIDELEGKMRDLEILKNIDLNKILEELSNRDKKIHKLETVDQDFQNKISSIEKVSQQQFLELKRRYEAERSAKMDAFEKLESMRLEMKGLEGKDVKNDLWKDKCKELYEICKDLEEDNENLKEALQTKQVEVQTLNQAMNEQSLKQQQSMEDTTAALTKASYNSKQTLRENMILQRNIMAKPMTAGRADRRRILSGGAEPAQKQPISVRGSKQNMAGTFYEGGTITSNLSLPGFDESTQRAGFKGQAKNRSHNYRGLKSNNFGQNTAGVLPKGNNMQLKMNPVGGVLSGNVLQGMGAPIAQARTTKGANIQVQNQKARLHTSQGARAQRGVGNQAAFSDANTVTNDNTSMTTNINSNKIGGVNSSLPDMKNLLQVGANNQDVTTNNFK